MKKEMVSATCVIYVGRTENENREWGKVGRVKGAWRLKGRTKEYKVADRDFWFVTRAAFEVSLPAGITPHTFETDVRYELSMRGLKVRGERVLPPEGSMELLVREVEDVIKVMGVSYEALDITALREKFERLNAQARAELDGIIASMEPCPYLAFLKTHSSPPWGHLHGRFGDRDRELMALGHLVRDLAAGSGISELRLDFGTDTLVVYPPTLSAALFQAGAEADLCLPTTLRFSVRPKSISDLPEKVAMLICRNEVQDSIAEDTRVDCYELPGPFMWEDGDSLAGVRFHPEHLACLGQIGMSEEICYYCGRGTRALMPVEIMPRIEANPAILPGVRFWLGLMHAQEAGIYLHGYRLPMELDWLLDGLVEAAQVLQSVGKPVPASLMTWVQMRFIEVRATA